MGTICNLYPSDTHSAILTTTANQLYPDGNTTSQTGVNTLIGTSTGWFMMPSRGAAILNAQGSEPAPDGTGWINDSSIIQGLAFDAGVYSGSIKVNLQNATGTVTADLYARVWLYRGGIYIPVAKLLAAGVVMSTSNVTSTYPYVFAAEVPAGASDHPYLDYVAHVTSNSSANAACVIRLDNIAHNAVVGGDTTVTYTPGIVSASFAAPDITQATPGATQIFKSDAGQTQNFTSGGASAQNFASAAPATQNFSAQ